MNTFAHRQGVILKDINEKFKTGQIVQIIKEEDDKYLIRKCYTSPIEKIHKIMVKTA
jgi:hypothetical protein